MKSGRAATSGAAFSRYFATGRNQYATAAGSMQEKVTLSTSKMSDADRDRIARRAALKRSIDVDDVANAVVFLMGDGARNITGTVLTVDAGNTA